MSVRGLPRLLPRPPLGAAPHRGQHSHGVGEGQGHRRRVYPAGEWVFFKFESEYFDVSKVLRKVC